MKSALHHTYNALPSFTLIEYLRTKLNFAFTEICHLVEDNGRDRIPLSVDRNCDVPAKRTRATECSIYLDLLM